MLLDKNSARSVQPTNANIKLKPHQLAMLQRCKDIEMLNKGYGIMADKPGAGKTFVMLSLVLNDQQKEKRPSLNTTFFVNFAPSFLSFTSRVPGFARPSYPHSLFFSCT